MMERVRRGAAVAALGALELGLTLLVAVTEPASASTWVSTKTLLSALPRGAEHHGGFSASRFAAWRDADGNGCRTPQEVLLRDAAEAPAVGSGCSLTGGSWFSPYDGVTVTDPAQMRVDHLVPLSEAWQSSAWRWDRSTRRRFTNDLVYRPSLVAVSAPVM